MKLAELGLTVAAAQAVRFTGQPTRTSFISTSGNAEEPYFVWRLKNPVTVGCSMDGDILPLEVDELHVRESLLQSDLWQKDKDGYFIPDYVHDFSLGQKICIYQSETIRAYVREERKNRRPERASLINSGIIAKMEERKKAAGNPKKS